MGGFPEILKREIYNENGWGSQIFKTKFILKIGRGGDSLKSSKQKSILKLIYNLYRIVLNCYLNSPKTEIYNENVWDDSLKSPKQKSILKMEQGGGRFLKLTKHKSVMKMVVGVPKSTK